MDLPSGLSGVGAEMSGVSATPSNGPTELADAFDSALESMATKAGEIKSNSQTAVSGDQIDTQLLPDAESEDVTIPSTIDSLKQVMDYATEMHLFVRSSTQVGSAMNTLIKGQ